MLITRAAARRSHSSYNALNGVPTCASPWLLDAVARTELGFDGYVTSDCDADNDVYFNHHYTSTPEESVAAILRAGTDVDCGGFIGKYAASALNKSVITTEDIDARLRKLMRVRMRLGHFDPPGALQQIARTEICSTVRGRAVFGPSCSAYSQATAAYLWLSDSLRVLPVAVRPGPRGRRHSASCSAPQERRFDAPALHGVAGGGHRPQREPEPL